MTGRSPSHSRSLTPKVQKSFREKVLFHMNAQGINQSVFADESGINQSMLSRYLNCNAFPSIETLIDVAIYLKVSLGYLCNPKIKPRDHDKHPCDVSNM